MTLFMDTPVGPITLAEEDEKLTHLLFGKREVPGQRPGKAPVLLLAQRQLEEYFAGTRRDFSLPLAPRGTNFQLRVWDALQTVPFGETRTYRWLAETADSPRGYRAVGMANNKNPISIIVPCHRVIGSNGSLTGYGGGLAAKEWLLAHENGAG